MFKYDKPNANVGGMLNQGNNVYHSTTTGTATRGTNVAIAAHAAANCTMSGSIADKAAFDSDTTGGSLSHNNLQPYLAIAYIISTGE
jgi:microcystin-dependent protein